MSVDPRPIPRIVSVTTAPKSILVVIWADGDVDSIDLSGWISTGGTLLAPLLRATTFAHAKPADYGLSVQWDDEGIAAIDSVHLEALCEQQRPFDRHSLAAWQERMGISNQEAADLLGIGLSTWHNYKSGETRIPRGVQIACRAIERDPILFEAHYRPRTSGRPSGMVAS